MFKSHKQMLEHTIKLSKQLKLAKSKAVAIGLPTEKVQGKVYNEGETVIEVGAQHEYGIGVPRRSFLKMPLELKKKEFGKFIQREYKKIVEEGKAVEKSLGLTGAKAYNIIQDAFITEGFGLWEPLSPVTIEEKGSNKILIDTGILRNSISWAVRDDT